MAKKEIKKKNKTKTKQTIDPNMLIDDIPGIVTSKVSNKQILQKLIETIFSIEQTLNILLWC